MIDAKSVSTSFSVSGIVPAATVASSSVFKDTLAFVGKAGFAGTITFFAAFVTVAALTAFGGGATGKPNMDLATIVVPTGRISVASTSAPAATGVSLKTSGAFAPFRLLNENPLFTPDDISLSYPMVSQNHPLPL